MSTADLAVDGEGVRAIAGRIDALATVLGAALESPRRHEVIHAAGEVLMLIREEARRVQGQAYSGIVVCELPGI